MPVLDKTAIWALFFSTRGLLNTQGFYLFLCPSTKSHPLDWILTKMLQIINLKDTKLWSIPEEIAWATVEADNMVPQEGILECTVSFLELTWEIMEDRFGRLEWISAVGPREGYRKRGAQGGKSEAFFSMLRSWIHFSLWAMEANEAERQGRGFHKSLGRTLTWKLGRREHTSYHESLFPKKW